MAPSEPITAERLEFYDQNGYLVVEEYFSREACDRLVHEADRLAAGHYTNILDLHEKSVEFHQLLTHQGILSMADAIQKARMIPLGSIFFYCKPDNALENGSVFHQDNYAVKAPFGSYFVCAVALDDADASNGALLVYPGSHKLGDLANVPSKNFEFDETGRISKVYPIGNEVTVPEGYERVQLRYSRGSLIFIHGHLVHGAPKNPSSTKWRRKIYLHYIKNGDPFWPGWNAKRRLIERDSTFQPSVDK